MRKKLLIATTKGFSFRSNRNIASKPNHLSFEVCYSVDPFKVQWHRWSHAATVPYEAPDAQKGQKRVPRDKRRDMVELFVNKYRAENQGKFPTITDAQNQVGGSFYAIRDIIQELKYKSKTISSHHSVNEILVEKQFDESKHPTTKSVSVSSGNIEIAKYNAIQDGSQSLDLNDKETVNTGYEHHEGKREAHTSIGERRLFEEVEIMPISNNHCIAPESNLVETCSKEPYPSSLHMPNDIKTEEADPSYFDSFAPESQLLLEEREHFSPLSSQNDGTGYDRARSRKYDFVHIENHQKLEEKCIKKANCESREQPDLEDLSRELPHSSLQVPNHLKGSEALSSSSDSLERHPLKEEINQFSAPFIEQSESSCSEGQSHDSKFVDMENHSAFEKAGYERKDKEAVDGSKHEIEQSQRSSELDESKLDSPNSRDNNLAVYSEKSTFWGNVKSFANDILNIWKKL
ncbi:hypothetical protein PHAVU_004G136200 [Phaseolus vulgaris]|uniref:AT3G52170-like helix-turn-helix domain-containing protein n=1 Tax=Phaseolus vulgaris TaxID=3885 RepID=V7C2V4_PHAVU|nr:hypothetical protein PHAVU_004G136200g [Phaseolus vulgaris]ESW24502.1 hypothetical protein PHAVU_004G136200g [Phaseolus vulgaris]